MVTIARDRSLMGVVNSKRPDARVSCRVIVHSPKHWSSGSKELRTPSTVVDDSDGAIGVRERGSDTVNVRSSATLMSNSMSSTRANASPSSTSASRRWERAAPQRKSPLPEPLDTYLSRSVSGLHVRTVAVVSVKGSGTGSGTGAAAVTENEREMPGSASCSHFRLDLRQACRFRL